MKKLVLSAAICVAVCFASCGNKTTSNANANDSDTTTVVDSVDSVAADTLK